MSGYLATERLLLRSATPDDAPLLATWKSQFNLREMSVGLTTVISEKNQRRDILNSIEDGNLYIIIELKKSHTPIGYIRLSWLDDAHNRCWLSYGLGSHYQEGYCYEALDRLLKGLYINKLINIIEAEVFEFNIPSKKLLEKLGFVYRGQRRNEYFYKGKHWAVLKYTFTPQDMKERFKNAGC